METKERIRKQALILFMNKGYREVSVNDIVATLGISKGAFYHHYKSKEHLFEEAVDTMFMRLFDNVTHALAEDVAQGHDIKEHLHTMFMTSGKMITHLGEGMLEEKESDELKYGMYVLLFEALRTIPSFTPRVTQMYRDMRTLLERILAQGKADGAIRKDVDETAWAIHMVSVLEGIVFIYTFDKDISLDDALTRLFQNIWESIAEKSDD